ncbi:MAG: type II toxin-antitoxin system VapC family toxin [Microcystis sp.]|jgi:predicted nucleic acid-binding protein|uniref:type II toxin-antitoxin system VapC family toxin n=1 Tax=Microcystis sp. TaxID=1127 RepID=UPI00391CD4F0
MEWLNLLKNQVVGLDTAPLIYFIEKNSLYYSRVQPFFSLVAQRHFQVVTSVITVVEVLVYPLRMGNLELAQQYRDILSNQAELSVLPVTETIAEQAAQLRATYNLRTPDAIQLATALNQKASFFLTNDNRLPQLETLQILMLNSLK